MELVTEPDVYAPCVDEDGKYIDKVPSFNNLNHGLRCPCGARKDKCYTTNTTFTAHIKTKTHQKWLEEMNLNKSNYYVEYEKLKELVQNQRLIIARLEKDLNSKNITIDYLTQQLASFISKDTYTNITTTTTNKNTNYTNIDIDSYDNYL